MEFAKANGYAILTFDQDFSELQNLYSYPPKIIWLRTGNLVTNDIANVLQLHKSNLEDFLADGETGIYEIYTS